MKKYYLYRNHGTVNQELIGEFTDRSKALAYKGRELKRERFGVLVNNPALLFLSS